MDLAEPALTLAFDPAQKERFINGELMIEWRYRYPELFDDEDVGIAESQKGAHFFEWLGAIVMHEATGYRCLLQSTSSRPTRGSTTMQGPDLLMYSPDESDFFFCEAKGPNDRLRRRQREFFDVISDATEKPIRLLRFGRLHELTRP